MKLIEACDIAWACGIETIGGVLDMVYHGANLLFNKENMQYEIEELINELTKYSNDTKIEDIYPEETKKWDKQLMEDMKNMF